MKVLYALLLSAIASTTSAQMPSHEQLVGEALKDYATVAGGWYLNQRCTFITGADATALDNDVAAITVALGRDIGNPTLLFNIQASAKKVANSDKFSACDESAKVIVTSASEQTRNWASQIKRIQGGQ